MTNEEAIQDLLKRQIVLEIDIDSHLKKLRVWPKLLNQDLSTKLRELKSLVITTKDRYHYLQEEYDG